MPSESLTITKRDLLTIQRGLKALDGHTGKDGLVRFDFGASLVWDAAVNRGVIDRAVATFESAKATLGAQLQVVSGQRLTDENAPRVAKYLEQIAELENSTTELIGITRLSRTALQKGGLNLPNVFGDLMPILEDK